MSEGRVEQVPYHRLFRVLRRYAWWRPLLAILVGTAYYLVLSIVLGIVLLVVGIAVGAIRIASLDQLADDVNALAQIDAASPFGLIFALSSVALMLPAVQLALLTVGLRPVGVRHSVAFRLRWRWLLLSLIPSTLVLVLSLGTGILLPGLIAGEWPLAPSTDLATFLVCAVVIVVLTPFQAAAEEYVFRGLLAQAVGAWIRYVPVAVVLPAVAFAAMHAYDAWGLVDVFLFGIAMGLVVWRTGGLEAAIGMHTLNNIAAFLMLSSGMFGTTVIESETAGPVGPAITLVTLGLWVLVVPWLARRAGVERVGAYAPPASPVQDPAVATAQLPPAPQPPRAE